MGPTDSAAAPCAGPQLHSTWRRPVHTQASVSKDYLGGLAITPDGLYTLAAAADGVLSLLDMRKAGARLSYASCSAPLRCVQTDGRYAAVGLENGQAYPHLS